MFLFHRNNTGGGAGGKQRGRGRGGNVPDPV